MLDLKVNVWSEIPQKTTKQKQNKIKFNKRHLHDEKHFLLEVLQKKVITLDLTITKVAL